MGLGRLILAAAILVWGTASCSSTAHLAQRQRLRASASPTASAPTRQPTPPPVQVGHVFVIVMENKPLRAILGNRSQAPYINRLASHYAVAVNYFAITHPSLPNYLALIGGSTFGLTQDCGAAACSVDSSNLVDQLQAHHLSWKAYMESMPWPCFTGYFYATNQGTYMQKHDPFMYFPDIRDNPQRCNRIVPLSELRPDLASGHVPNFVWITPNGCHDMHDCPVAAGDSWLATIMPEILTSSAWRDGGVVFITFDESYASDTQGCCHLAAGGRVLTLIVSPLVRPGLVITTPYDHYSLLRTVEDIWHLGTIRGATCRCTKDMAALLH